VQCYYTSKHNNHYFWTELTGQKSVNGQLKLGTEIVILYIFYRNIQYIHIVLEKKKKKKHYSILNYTVLELLNTAVKKEREREIINFKTKCVQSCFSCSYETAKHSVCDSYGHTNHTFSQFSFLSFSTERDKKYPPD